jgi:hypothetical protein
MIACQVVAMVWLVRSISREHWMRSMVSAASVCASAVILLLMGVFCVAGVVSSALLSEIVKTRLAQNERKLTSGRSSFYSLIY